MVLGSCSSRVVTSSRWTVMRGSAAMRAATRAENSIAVDGEGVAGGDGGGVGVGEEEGAGAAHLLLEEPGGGVFGLGLEGVGADEFGEVGGLVGLGGAGGAHLVEVDFAAEGGGLEGGFGAGESAADDLDTLGCHASPSSPDLCQSLPTKRVMSGLGLQVLDSRYELAQSLPSMGFSCEIAGEMDEFLVLPPSFIMGLS